MKKVHIMTKEKELQLLPEELTCVVWICPKCGAEQGIDISSKIQTEKLDKAERFIGCGICGQRYEPGILQAFQSLVIFYEKLQQYTSDHKIFFRVYIKDSDKKESES